MSLQALFDGMAEAWRQERAATQMTISKLLERLNELDDETLIEGLSDPHSYRGYYSDLALEPGPEKVAVRELKESVSEVLGTELCGYKGCDFLMAKDTPVWVANYGCCGQKLIAINDDGTLELEDDD